MKDSLATSVDAYAHAAQAGSEPQNIDILIVIDAQMDFTTGSLGNEEAASKIPSIEERVANFDGIVIFTKDTHPSSYLQTQEGKLLPIKHCIEGTNGAMLAGNLEGMANERGWAIYEKPTFGSVELARDLAELDRSCKIGSIELVGFCTDICVVSNALTIKAHLPEVPINVDEDLCAGTSRDAHDAALTTMRSCQIAC